jgi:DNA-directed RNA polymerase specialized sigma24 family protein
MGRIETFYRQNFKRLTGFIKEYTDGSYEVASDIVQMVFVRLLEMEAEGRTNFYEEDTLNFFYVYRSCINTAFKYQRAKRKVNKVSIDEITYDAAEQLQDPAQMQALEKLITYMEDEMQDMHWYDSKMLRIHMEGTSMNKIHRESDIGLTSIKNTIKNGKARIYDRVREDWEDFQNGDYHKI